MIASQASSKMPQNDIVEVSSSDCVQEKSLYNLNMAGISGLEDKNGNFESVKENVSSDFTEKVCRTCLSLTEPQLCVLIESFDNTDRIGNMVATCLPQINLLLTNDPVVCQNCYSKLEDFYDFLMICLETENKLVNYCSAHHLTTPANLYDIVRTKTETPDCVVKVENEDSMNSSHAEIDNNEDNMDSFSNDGELNNECDPTVPEEPNDTDLVKNKKVVRVRRKILKKKVPKPKPEVQKSLFSEDLAEAAVKCETCSKKFPTKWALDRHIPVHKEDRKFSCDTCSMAFRYKHSFEKHLLVHLSGAPVTKPFACACGKYFNRKAKLLKHQQIHVKKDKPFGCEDCGKRFIDEQTLSSHVFRVHASEKAFSCEMCGNKYSSKSGLDVHFKTHFPSDKPRPEPDLMCDFCGKLFYRKYSLEKHRMSHTGDKPHECEQCGMRFKERYQLTIHNRRHTGEKPFDCEICGFKFPSKNRLVVHMRIHTGVRPFPCNMCDMAFTRKDHLIKHVRAIHTGERPFECEICTKTFNRRDYLIKHKKVHVKHGL